MDIDASRGKGLPARSCHRCGSMDHLILDCPHRFDVHHMTSDERKACFEGFLAERDTQGTVYGDGQAEEVTVVEREVSEEDFVRSSG